jgi:transcription antitermination factor NusA-like protein
VRSPICSFDAKTGVLCTKCEMNLSEGIISQDDVDASIKLTRLAERNADINKLTLLHATRVNGDLVLMLRSADVSMLRSNANITDKIKTECGQNVWFIESEASDRRFIENLLYPITVSSVNQFWLPDGNKLTRVIVSQKAQINIEKVQKIAKAVRGIELLIELQQK